MTKRVLSLLLVLVMVLSLSVPALAAEGEETDVAAVEQTETTPVAAEAADEPAEAYDVLRPSTAHELNEAIANGQGATAADPIQLAYDIEIDASEDVTVDRTVYLDVAGSTVDEMTVDKGGNLVLLDTIKNQNGAFVGGIGTLTTAAGGKFDLQAGNVNTLANSGTGTITGASVTTVSAAGTLTISAGSVTNNIPVNAKESLTITGGAVPGGVTQNDGSLYISGGKTGTLTLIKSVETLISGGVVDGGSSYAIKFPTTALRGRVNISITGGTFYGDPCAIQVEGGQSASATPHYISAGKFVPSIGGEQYTTGADNASNVPIEVALGATVAVVVSEDVKDKAGPKFTVVGQSMVEDVVDNLESGDVLVVRGAATFTGVSDDVYIENDASNNRDIVVNGKTLEPGDTWGRWEASIGEDKYETLAEAIDEARSGDTIKVLRNCATSPDAPLYISKKLTFDLNGKVVVLRKNMVVTGTTVTFTGTGDIKNNLNGDDPVPGNFGIYCNGNATVVLEDTYCHVPVYCNDTTRNNTLNVMKEGYVDGSIGMVGTTVVPFTGNLTVSGKVTGSIYVDAKVAKVLLEGEVKNSVFVCGDDVTFEMRSPASIGGSLILGDDAVAAMSALSNHDHVTGLISGGTVKGDVDIQIERHSDLSITGGVFKGDMLAITCEEYGVNDEDYGFGRLQVVSGGEFKSIRVAVYAVEGVGVAQIIDKANPSPINNNYYFVGDSIDTNIAKVSKGTLKALQGTTDLTTVASNVLVVTDYVEIKTGGSANVSAKDTEVVIGNVTIGSAAGNGEAPEGVIGSSITQLNGLIAHAYEVSGSGKLSESDQKALARALTEAIAPKYDTTDAKGVKTTAQDKVDAPKYDTTDAKGVKTTAQDKVDASIAALNAALAEFPETDPDVPWVPDGYTDWQKNPNTGNWYFFVNGVKQTNIWVYSKNMIWYYLNDQGIMQIGVQYAKAARTYSCITGQYSSKYEPAGWYYFETSADSDAPGRIRGGWHKTAQYGWVWSNNVHDGKYGMITWTDATRGPIPTPAQ